MTNYVKTPLSLIFFLAILASCTSSDSNNEFHAYNSLEKKQQLDSNLDEAYTTYRNNLLKELSKPRGGLCQQIEGTGIIQVIPFTESEEKIAFLKKLENLSETCKKNLASNIVKCVDWDNFVALKEYDQISNYDEFVEKNIFSKILKINDPCDKYCETLISICLDEKNNLKTDWIYEFVAVWHVKYHINDVNGWKFLLANMIFEEEETPYFSEITRIVLKHNLDKYPLGRKLIEIQKMGPNEYSDKILMIMKSIN